MYLEQIVVSFFIYRFTNIVIYSECISNIPLYIFLRQFEKTCWPLKEASEQLAVKRSKVFYKAEEKTREIGTQLKVFTI